MEFVVLASIMFLFFGIVIVYTQDILVQFTKASKEQQLSSVQEAILSEISAANRMPTGYSRVFTLPTDIQGLSYTIQIEQEALPRKDALIIQTKDTEVLVYLDYDVTGTLQPGSNRISRGNTVVLN